MKTRLQDYAHAARVSLHLAHLYRQDSRRAARYRDTAREFIAEGKALRNIKRQADMWGQLFNSLARGRH